MKKFQYPTGAQLLGVVARYLCLKGDLKTRGKIHPKTHQRNLNKSGLLHEDAYQEEVRLFIDGLLPADFWSEEQREATRTSLTRALDSYHAFSFRMSCGWYASTHEEKAAALYGLLRLLVLEVALCRGSYLCLCEFGEVRGGLDFFWVYSYENPFILALRHYSGKSQETDSTVAQTIADALGPELEVFQDRDEVDCYGMVVSWLQDRHTPKSEHLEPLARALAETSGESAGYLLLGLRLSLGFSEALSDLYLLLSREIVVDLLRAFGKVSELVGRRLREKLTSCRPPTEEATASNSLPPLSSEQRDTLFDLMQRGSASALGEELCDELSQRIEVWPNGRRVWAPSWTEFAADLKTLPWVWDFRICRWAFVWVYIQSRPWKEVAPLFTLCPSEHAVCLSQVLESPPNLLALLKENPEVVSILRKNNPALFRLAANSTSTTAVEKAYHREIHLYFAEMAFSCGDFGEAFRQFQAVLDKSPEEMLYHRLGQVAFVQAWAHLIAEENEKTRASLEKASEALRQALALGYRHPGAMRLQAYLLLWLGRMEEFRKLPLVAIDAQWREALLTGAVWRIHGALQKSSGDRSLPALLMEHALRYQLRHKHGARALEKARKKLREIGVREEWVEQLELRMDSLQEPQSTRRKEHPTEQ